MKKLQFVLLIFISAAMHAQDTTPKWGLEVELIQPFIPDVQIFQVQATRSLFDNGAARRADLVLGAYMRPNVKHDVVEEIDEYMLLVAYRHYVWKGLHVEPGINVGYYWGWNNLIDGQDYEGIGVFWEANIGYKFNLGAKKRFYTVFQAGGLGSLHSDIGPRGGKPDTFPNINLMIGVNF